MTPPTPPVPLAELLRRCHRDELLPLCWAVGVNPDGLGLGQLAGVLERSVRRAGGHVLMNVLRRGEGPSYERVLRGLMKRLGLQAPPEAEAEALERMLTAGALTSAWDKLEPAARARAWSLLGMDGEPPTNGSRALNAAQSRLGRSAGYRVATLLVGSTAARVVSLALLPFAPVGALSALWYFGRPRLEVLLPTALEVARLRQIVRHRITIGVVGSPSAGKDSALGALFGVRTGDVHPIAGSTRTVAIHRVPGATALYVVNTPGLGDIDAALNEETRQVLDHIDVYLYVVNAQGGVQAREKADWDRVAATGRPALALVNKIDTLRERDRVRYLEDARQKLGVEPGRLLGVAFDPLPQLEPGPLGLAAVRDWLRATLGELGKDTSELPTPSGAG